MLSTKNKQTNKKNSAGERIEDSSLETGNKASVPIVTIFFNTFTRVSSHCVKAKEEKDK